MDCRYHSAPDWDGSGSQPPPVTMLRSLRCLCRLQPTIGHVRTMSQYPPTFREPTLPPEQTDEAREQLTFSPIKAAPSDLTSSAFDHPAVKKFTNIIMKGGDKNLAQILMAKTFERIKRTQIQRLHATRDAASEGTPDQDEEPVCDPLQVFLKALENSKPRLQLVPIIRGGITYQGRVVRLKQELHRQCEANRAYAHYTYG
ncbi:28S ribosomal protein S7, mitochondrial [Amphibalanus amphitrite]|uniref:28S ribosomal protein S7, mitochondrial n=1 Tax=Amphibalanus amphitrite TaxID=1232801 RepID=A0A6A4VQG1_AMPAM|nr:28S ribosomal protein S7, mitochondrial [Amphibalanus amphitrite]